ncbi:phosphoribosylformylglycinamidine synthase [Amycolatopsis xylanica]|uniref:Phosphoribosylformylglycinamidine synthase n=1 Tax=Amycolatopsis xylanica TaxID=589385 RepID=A0A1H3G1X7_9PSEU|nr:phosphoribosylformylglycinamidine synthase subunit PurQ [Amycolatopsis xylanica]SDX96688.1 phosphoribosylformylglycinamidine synthase [Amycolatopsis xylanica]
MKPTVNVLYLPGTNCQDETLRAFRDVGAEPRLRFVADVLDGSERLDDADILCVPGGFSFGDHLGGGSVASLLLKTRLADQFNACLTRPLLGICNGFQIALRAGCFGEGVALKVNAAGTFRNEPHARHVVEPGNESPWLTGLSGQTLAFPFAHGEGRFSHLPEATEGWQAALRYADGSELDGSQGGIAGITSADGLAFGLMNHPERAMNDEIRLAFFENGVRAAA